MFTNKWEVQCCSSSSSDKNCKDGGGVSCSSKVSDSNEYFGMCPQNNKDNCGFSKNYMNLDLYAGNDKTTFNFDNLRWKTNAYKIPAYGACTYKIMNPPGGFTSGKVYMTIKKKEKGVRIYLKSNGKYTASLLNKEFSVDNGEEFMLTAVPTKNSFNTSFTIQYRTDGAKDPNSPIWTKIEEHKL
jgi:hypothetical protein